MANVVNVSEENFNEEVIEVNQPVLVDFWAPWCGYCTKLAPVLDELAEEYGDKVSIVKVNVDENRKVAEQYGVMSLPTIIVFKDGDQVEKLIGYMPKAAISAKLKPYL